MMKDSSKREQNDACISFAERESLSSFIFQRSSLLSSSAAFTFLHFYILFNLDLDGFAALLGFADFLYEPAQIDARINKLSLYFVAAYE